MGEPIMQKINTKELKEIIALFEDAQLTRMELKTEGMELTLEKCSCRNGSPKEETATPSDSPDREKEENQEECTAEDEEILTITSPLVGTFYSSSSPDEEAFVTEGSETEEDTTVCLIESMKVFTEIPAGLSGVITEVLVKDGDFVEYDQPLFRIRAVK